MGMQGAHLADALRSELGGGGAVVLVERVLDGDHWVVLAERVVHLHHLVTAASGSHGDCQHEGACQKAADSLEERILGELGIQSGG